MAINNSKLTSVKVIDDLYQKFKIHTVNSDMNLQRLTNRCIHLYLSDEGFKNLVDDVEELTISGSSL